MITLDNMRLGKSSMKEIMAMVREGLIPPSAIEIATLAEVSAMPRQVVKRLPLRAILHYGFQPSRCFSNVASIQNGTPRFGWMTNDAEEAFILHSVVELPNINGNAGTFLLCVTPPFDWHDEKSCEFILDGRLVPKYDNPEGGFNGCERDGVRIPRLLRKNFESSRFYFSRLGVYVMSGLPLEMAQQMASVDANNRDGKPMIMVG